jgi:hypothetical protein
MRATSYGSGSSSLSLKLFAPGSSVLLPDLVTSVAMTIENYGLEFVSYRRIKPLFNPESLWRIPPDINLTPVSLPARKITGTDVVALNERRAGNRGMANRRKTTPVFA